MTFVVVVGRFQVPRLHPGHELFLKWAHSLGDRLLIVIGSANEKGTKKNPLHYHSRWVMLRGWADWVTGIPDFPGDDQKWSSTLDALVEDWENYLLPPGFDKTILVCGRDGFKSHYHGKYEVQECPIDMQPEWSGTAIRTQIGQDPTHYESEQFRAGVIWGIENSKGERENESHFAD